MAACSQPRGFLALATRPTGGCLAVPREVSTEPAAATLPSSAKEQGPAAPRFGAALDREAITVFCGSSHGTTPHRLMPHGGRWRDSIAKPATNAMALADSFRSSSIASAVFRMAAASR